MEEGKEKTTLPKEIQLEMMKFFLKTSIPRKKMEKLAQQEQQANSLSQQ